MVRKTITMLILVESDLLWMNKCLPKLGFTDEIIIVDNGTDKSIEKEIMDNFPDLNIRYYFDTELNPVTKMLKYASVVTSDFIFWLHADEILSDELGSEISLVLETDENIDAYAICPFNFMFGTDFGRAETHSVRIMLKEKFQFRNSGSVHAEIMLTGVEEISSYNGLTVKKLKGKYVHYPNPFFLLYAVKIFRYEMINTKDLTDITLDSRINKHTFSFAEILKFSFLLGRTFFKVFWSNRKYGFGGFCLACGYVVRIMAERIAPIEERQFRESVIDFNDTRGYINLNRKRPDANYL